MKLSVLLILLTAPYLSAGSIADSAFASAGCYDFSSGQNIEFVESSQDGYGSASASAVTSLCGASSFARVTGLDFFVEVDEGIASDYQGFGSADISGGEWFIITGGTGDALAYFTYDVGPFDPFNPSYAYTNAGVLYGFGSQVGPFEFTFGEPFVLTVDAHAGCCHPSGYLQGYFSSLNRVTTLDGTTTLNATLTDNQFPAPPVPNRRTRRSSCLRCVRLVSVPDAGADSLVGHRLQHVVDTDPDSQRRKLFRIARIVAVLPGMLFAKFSIRRSR